jgi:hypothetical protein
VVGGRRLVVGLVGGPAAGAVLEVELPRPVNEAGARARFDAKRGALTVRFPAL